MDNEFSFQNDKDSWELKAAKDILKLEAHCILQAADKIDKSFLEAVKKVYQCTGRVITTGIGKSGHIAAKAASTMTSTGTSSFYLHAAEASHGDFGFKEDCLLAISYGGGSREVLSVIQFAKQNRIPSILITGNQTSPASELADIIIDTSVHKEADPMGLVPTCSSTLALAVLDSLAITVMQKKKFGAEDFARLHPGGRLGKSMARVLDYMRPAAEVSAVSLDASLSDALLALNKNNFGIIAVVSKAGDLCGALTDGDIRRLLLKHKEAVFSQSLFSLIACKPKAVDESENILNAISFMEKYKITSVFVVNKNKKGFLGLLRMHDLIDAKII